MSAAARRTTLATSGADGMAIGTAQAAGHPDAELIEVCRQHCINMDAYNASDEANLAFDDTAPQPLGEAYDRTRDFISAAKPQTMDGILAKARAALHEGTNPSGQIDIGGTPGEQWALDLIHDLVRIGGAA